MVSPAKFQQKKQQHNNSRQEQQQVRHISKRKSLYIYIYMFMYSLQKSASRFSRAIIRRYSNLFFYTDKQISLLLSQ